MHTTPFTGTVLSTFFTEPAQGALSSSAPLQGIITMYGAGATGKTTSCLILAAQYAHKGIKSVFIDTEGGFSTERLKQIEPLYQDILDHILLFSPKDFNEQCKHVDKLIQLTEKGNVGLVIIDTLGSHYRVVLKEDPYTANKALDMQLRTLAQICRQGVTVLATNQVYHNLEKNETGIVGGDMVRNWSTYLIELQKMNQNKRLAVLRKHPRNAAGKSVAFTIVENGFKALF